MQTHDYKSTLQGPPTRRAVLKWTGSAVATIAISGGILPNFGISSVLATDLGVSAYNGAGKLIKNPDYLLAAGKIFSVEARHAAIVRRIGGKKAWDSAFDEPKSKEDVLAAAKPFLKA